MADVTDYKVYKNTQFEILTDEGFKDFEGLIIGKNRDKTKLTFGDDTSLICTPKHKLMIDKKDYVYAKDSCIGDVVYGDKEIREIETYSSDDLVYEILDVKDIHRYYVNGILSHQCLMIDECAFIPEHIMKEFWNSVIPVISSSAFTKVFVVSTPNGAGNLFHKIYSGAERGDPAFEQWNHERVDWWEIPSRGKKWEEAMRSLLASEDKSFDQEFGCMFLETGHSAVDAKLIELYRAISCEPTYKFEDGNYKVWKEPNPEHLYSIGVDVGEGIGQAASVAQVLDITDLTDIQLVATYHNNLIDPFHFGEMLNNIANQWGRPMLAIERNNCGGQVIDALKQTHGYHNIIDHTPKTMAKGGNYYSRLGIYSHTNSKYQGIINMRYWVNSLRAVKVYDVALIQELETFVRYPNGTWKGKPGDYIYDDRVLALVWGLFVLDKDIAEQYYEVSALDDRGKPAKIQPVTIEESKYFKLDRMYIDDPNAPMPSHVNTTSFGSDPTGVDSLQDQGWEKI
jgi:hypothetical protein